MNFSKVRPRPNQFSAVKNQGFPQIEEEKICEETIQDLMKILKIMQVQLSSIEKKVGKIDGI